MPLLSRVLALALAIMVLVPAGCATHGATRVAADSRLDGTWSGSLTVGNDPNDLLQLRLSLAGDSARVWLINDGMAVEAKPNSFQVNKHRSNAVLYATDSGEDADGTWVESWAFLVTPRTSDELVVVWSRLVNNVDMPLEKESSKFTVTGSGVLQRVPSDG